uniref:FAM3 metabolism regulating signaling molecule D n=1 Tax=Sphenodon punctatus TaxID=8508 RepID=A0A8D0GG22_SPHPU
MRVTGLLRVLAVIITLAGTWFFVQTYLSNTGQKFVSLRSWLGKAVSQPVKNKCNNAKSCPENYYAFKIISGAANVVGPSMCFEGTVFMSSVKNNIGRGLNIVLVNGEYFQGEAAGFRYVKLLLNFLKPIQEGTIVLIASYDDPATKLNDEERGIFTSLGSSYAAKLAFRDNWIFLGAKGLHAKSPFEQHIKNSKETNKYDGWPEMLEMEGCVPKKID